MAIDTDTILAAVSSPKLMGIYAIWNIVTGRKYIGSSVNIRERYTEHRRLLRKGTHHNPHLQRAWNKHGADSFKIEVVQVVGVASDLCRVEQFYLNTEDSLYNTAPFAERPTNLGKPHSEETKAKIGAANKKRLTGRKLSPESIAKRTASVLGQKRSPETRARISAANKGRSPSPLALSRAAEFHRGRPLSAETKAKVSAALTGIKHSPEFCAAIGDRTRGIKRTPEQVANMTAARWTPEARAKHSALQKGTAPLKALEGRRAQIERAQNSELLTINGITRPLMAWSQLTGVLPDTIRKRLRYGKTPHDAVFTPSQRRNRDIR